MTDNLYEITADVPLPTTMIAKHGKIISLIYSLKPGESFLCRHYASGSIARINRDHPERTFTRRRDPETGLVRIWRKD